MFVSELPGEGVFSSFRTAAFDVTKKMAVVTKKVSCGVHRGQEGLE